MTSEPISVGNGRVDWLVPVTSYIGTEIKTETLAYLKLGPFMPRIPALCWQYYVGSKEQHYRFV
jgi:hypothetical protein